MKNTIYTLLTLYTCVATNSHANTSPPQSQHPAIMASYGNIPLSFEANQGQADQAAQYVARGPGYTVLLSPSGATLGLTHSNKDSTPPDTKGKPTDTAHTSTVLHMNLVAANANAPVAAVDELPGKVNYLQGNNPANWHTNIPTYGKVKYQQVYKGIDVVYYGNQRQLEYDFIVAPGANPKQIRLSFTGSSAKDSVHPQLNASGELRVGDMQLKKPLIYQEEAGQRKPIEGQFVVHADHQVGFKLAAYNPKLPLVIDPLILLYSTYLGDRSSDTIYSIAVDASGQAYVTGVTASPDFPTTVGSVDTTHNFNKDVFVSKLNAAGNQLLYSTFLGGTDVDEGNAIAVDAAGQAYVTGYTSSLTFPTTTGSMDTSHNGSRDVFVSKLNDTGSALLYSTFLGGNSIDIGYGIAVDAQGQVYITGGTVSKNFPATAEGVDTTHDGSLDVFVSKLNAAGNQLLYSTFLGGTGSDQGNAIAVDAGGNAYITGKTFMSNFPTTPNALKTTAADNSQDAFVSKLNDTGSQLLYSTYLGGNGGGEGKGIAVGAAGQAYVTGSTYSSTFPTTTGSFDTSLNNASQDGFVSKLNATGSELLYSTFLGGDSNDIVNGIVVDAAGQAYVTGTTLSTNFPTTADGVDTSHNGSDDVFVSQLNATGNQLLYSTFLGGDGYDRGLGIALSPPGRIYVAGVTESGNFPTTAGSQQTTLGGGLSDGFITALAPGYILTTSRTGTGTGVISSSPTGIICGLDCTEGYLANTQVTLTATPADANSVFMGWTGDCVGSGACNLTLDAKKTVEANFAAVFTVSVAISGSGGSVSSAPSGINCGSTCSAPFVQGASVNLTAIPAAGYSFAGWGGACSGVGTCTLTVDAAKSVSAQFVQGNLLAVTKQGDGSGTVTSSPAGINCGTDCLESYDKNKLVYLTAKPAADSVFSGWSGAAGACNKAPTCYLRMDVAKNITATFTKKPPAPTFVLTVTQVGNGTVTSSPAGINCGSDCIEAYPKNQLVTLTATPTAGAVFRGWSGVCRGISKTCRVTMSAAKSVTATFK